MTVTGFDPHEDGATFLDERHAYRYVHNGTSGDPIGLIESHQLADGRWCEGSVMFKGRGGGKPEWTVVLADPLTLSPSILCRGCGEHFWLDGGRARQA